MDFQPTDDQRALQEGVRAFCAGRVTLDEIRKLDGVGFERGLWAELAELGTFGLRVPEAVGGLGLGTADAVLVFEELGRALAPGPLVWTHLAAGLVDGAAAGETVVGGLDLAAGADGPCLIEHRDQLDVLLVLRADGVWRLDPAAIACEPIAAPLDPLTPLHHAAALPEGERIASALEMARLRLEGAALVAAQQLGIAIATQEMAVEYAGKREQFGRPIGSFQAIKHMCADMFVRQEAARAAVYAAGATFDDPGVGDIARAVAAAKILAGEAAMKNARTCIQVHGGMGYTWEVPVHYYLKRAWVLETSFGTIEEHADRVASLVDAGAA